MRLPGTFNIGYNNDLLPIGVIAAARRECRASETAANTSVKKKKSDTKLQTNGGKDAKATENDSGFTAKQDKKLLKLKLEEKKTWKDIATALGKDVGQVKERWQHVRPDKQDGDKATAGGDAKKEESKHEGNKKDKRKDNKDADESDEIVLEPDTNFNFDEVCLYYELSHPNGHKLTSHSAHASRGHRQRGDH